MPTLARLCLWADPDRVDELEEAYEQQLAPMLRQRGLDESPERGRTTVAGVCSRLFAFDSPKTFRDIGRTLRRDSVWQNLLLRLGSRFHPDNPQRLAGDGLHFTLYSSSAQPDHTVAAGPGTRRGEWLSFGVQDGLPSVSIASVGMTRDGCLWLLSEGGLTRYDGETLSTFAVEGADAGRAPVARFLEDRDGRLWCGTQRGLLCLDGRDFALFTTADGLAGHCVHALLEDRDGHLWCGTEAGLSRYDGETFRTFSQDDGLPTGGIMALAQDREGRVCVGLGHYRSPRSWELYGVSRLDGETFHTVAGPDGMLCRMGLSMYAGSSGDMWFGGLGEVVRCDGDSYRTFTSADGLMDDAIVAIHEDQDGSLWLGSNGSGLSRYDGRALHSFTTDSGLPNNQIRHFAEDEDGVVWAGLHGGGVCRYDGKRLASFTPGEGLPSHYVYSVLQDRSGAMCFATGLGDLARYAGGKWDTYTSADGLPADHLESLVEDPQGNLWMGHSSNLVSRYDGESFATFRIEPEASQDGLHSMAVDQRGHAVQARGCPGAGVSRYDGSGWRTFTTRDGLISDEVRSVAGDESGHVWLGTDCGVSRFTPPKTDGEEGTWLSIEGGLHTAAVVAIAVGADGELWFGHEDGLVTRYGDTAKVLTHEDGLKPGLMRRILVDGGGRLWFSVFGAGIVRYDGLVFQDLSQRDGLISDSTQGMCQDRDGAFWIATDNGVTRYCPVTTPPAVRIREVVADRTYGAGDGVTLHASQELVQISFQGRSLSTAPDRMAYVYRLRGRLDEWQATRQRRVQLTGLDEGEYVFEVRAVDLDLNYSEPATVRITVEPDPRDQALAQALSAGGPMGEFVGSSPALRQVQQQLAQAAPTDLAVLILGETGTGKGLAARLVHELSPRQEHALIQVNCGAIPGGLVESELFGHEKGAFTSAVSRHLGKAELAHGGTLFLDEIGDFPLEAQVKLLRLLEEGTFERVGGTKVLEADVRIVAATNRDLEEMVRDDRLRPDLYYRLQGFPVRLPPLRERLDDVELLALYFAERMANHLNKPAPALSTAALDLLRSYDWPGNVRELEHAIQRATIVCGGPVLEPGDVALGYGPSHSGPDAQGSVATLAECERSHILQVLERTGWRISGEQGAADLLGVPVSTLRSRMKKLAIERPRD